MHINYKIGDCREVLANGFEEGVFDACVTDPPYGLEFMGKEWDKLEPNRLRQRWKGTEKKMFGDWEEKKFHGLPQLKQQRMWKCKKCGRYKWGGNPCTCKQPEFDIRGYGKEQYEWHYLWAKEVYRVLKPGGYLLAFGGTRTYHRMVCAVEDAGFEIRDTIAWIYGSGFPKSMDISKQIDKMRNDDEAKHRVADWLRPHIERVGFDVVTKHFGFVGETVARARWTTHSKTDTPSWEQWLELKELCGFGDEMDAEVWRLNKRKGQPGENWDKREITGKDGRAAKESIFGVGIQDEWDITAPATPDAKKWNGWGTALKPAVEPIVVARKPISEKNVAMNVLAYGVGGINVDGCRIGTSETLARPFNEAHNIAYGEYERFGNPKEPQGRFPANIILDDHYLGDESRFFYIAKASRRERWFYCSVCKKAYSGDKRDNHKKHSMHCLDCDVDYEPSFRPYTGTDGVERTIGNYGMTSEDLQRCRFEDDHKSHKTKSNLLFHVTQKPEQLIRYLIRLVTPKGGTVLDPFVGSGTTLVAARMEGMNALGIELSEEYEPLISVRIEQKSLFQFDQETE